MSPPTTAVSLFAGIGGFDLALERNGVKVVAAVEIDKQARGVLAHHFPDATLFNDVNEVTGDQLRAAGFIPESGILTGGFPCQPFSVAGRRRGMGGGDQRGELYWQISRLLDELAPAWVILENVPGLLSIDAGRTMGTILGDLGRLGYGYTYRVLDAQHFGLAQRRKRVFIVGCLGDGRRAAQVLLESEGRRGDSAPSLTPRTRTTGTAQAGTLTTRVGQLDDADTGSLVVSTLQGGGAAWQQGRCGVSRRRSPRGGVVNALTAAQGGPDDNDAQAGHLVYVKAIRSGARAADGSLPPEVWEEGGVSPTMTTFDNGETRATVLTVTGGKAHALTSEGHDASEDGTGRGTPIIVTSWQGGPTQDHFAASSGVAPTLSGGGNTNNGHHQPKVETESGVRRLTPTECERLQGFPDGWTAERADGPQADSSRYRQLGNAVAVPVVEWIVNRIVEATA